MKMDKPIFTDCVCVFCHHKWSAVMPDGLNQSHLECPACHKMTPLLNELVELGKMLMDTRYHDTVRLKHIAKRLIDSI